MIKRRRTDEEIARVINNIRGELVHQTTTIKCVGCFEVESGRRIYPPGTGVQKKFKPGVCFSCLDIARRHRPTS